MMWKGDYWGEAKSSVRRNNAEDTTEEAVKNSGRKSVCVFEDSVEEETVEKIQKNEKNGAMPGRVAEKTLEIAE